MSKGNVLYGFGKVILRDEENHLFKNYSIGLHSLGYKYYLYDRSKISRYVKPLEHVFYKGPRIDKEKLIENFCKIGRKCI